MAKYLLSVPVYGQQFYVVEADSVDDAIDFVDNNSFLLAEPVDTDVVIDGGFELQDIVEPCEND